MTTGSSRCQTMATETMATVRRKIHPLGRQRTELRGGPLVREIGHPVPTCLRRADHLGKAPKTALFWARVVLVRMIC